MIRVKAESRAGSAVKIDGVGWSSKQTQSKPKSKNYIDIQERLEKCKKNHTILSILKWTATTIPYSTKPALNYKKHNNNDWKSITYKEYYNILNVIITIK